MSETERFLALSTPQQEEVFRHSIRQFFQENPDLIEVNKGLLSDERVANARAQFIKEILERGDHTPIEIFELWVKVMREESQRHGLPHDG